MGGVGRMGLGVTADGWWAGVPASVKKELERFFMKDSIGAPLTLRLKIGAQARWGGSGGCDARASETEGRREWGKEGGTG